MAGEVYSESVINALTVENDLGQTELVARLRAAIISREMPIVKQCLNRALALGLKGPLIERAKECAADKELQNWFVHADTLRFYLKQGMEKKSREQLHEALKKVDELKSPSTGVPREFTELVEQARKTYEALCKENAATLSVYIKQGIHSRNRSMLKVALEQVHKFPGSESLDKELVDQARKMMQQLDHEHMLKTYLVEAYRAKDEEALAEAVERAKEAKIDPTCPEFANAQRRLAELQFKKARKHKGIGTRIMDAFKTQPPSVLSAAVAAGHAPGSGTASPPRPSIIEKKEWRLFGGDLKTAVLRSNGLPIPKICKQCIEFIEARGLKEHGLFRIPGNNDEIEALKAQFSNDEEVALKDVHDTAGLLKLYLRKLEQPLVPSEFYQPLIKVANERHLSQEQRNEQYAQLIAKMPRENRALLRTLFALLVKVAAHKEVNMMDSNNIAIVFAPTLMKPKQETPTTMLADAPLTIAVISGWIDDYEAIFSRVAEITKESTPAETPDDASSVASDGEHSKRPSQISLPDDRSSKRPSYSSSQLSQLPEQKGDDQSSKRPSQLSLPPEEQQQQQQSGTETTAAAEVTTASVPPSPANAVIFHEDDS